MKAITIKQPWASLIVHGIKDIENRTWPCPEKYIGQRVLIHASKAKAKSLKFQLTDDQIKCVYDHFIGDIPLLIEPKGAIIGSVEIVDCIQNHPSIWAEKSLDNKCPKCRKHINHYLNWGTQTCIKCGYICKQGVHYAKPVYNWVLANPIIYEKPIENVKGKLSFWDYLGIEEVKIECPECGSIEIAVEDHTTEPFSTYLHSCNKCGHVIIESEWNKIKIKTKKRK